jgi:hypothetical protein
MCLSRLLCQCRMSRPLRHIILVPSPLRHIILVPRNQSTQAHYPRSETTVHSDTLSSFPDISPLRHIILVPIMCLSGLGTRVMCSSGLLCKCRMSRNEDNLSEWTCLGSSETSGTDTTVYSDTLSSFRDNSPLRHIILVPSLLRHIILVPSPLKHIILVPRHPALTQQFIQTHYPRVDCCL